MEAVNSSSTTIVGFKKEKDGEMIAKAFLAVIVTELVGSFNVGKTMDAMQVAFAVNGIQADYYFLKVDELKYCFENAKKGRYGTMYDRIDAAVIFGWIEKYLEERIQICYQQNVEQNKIYNSNSEKIHPDIAEKLKGFINDKVPENIPKDKYVRKEPENETEALIQSFFKEFDEAYIKNPIGENRGKRFIEYKIKIVDQDEYIDLRLKENKQLKSSLSL